jgi:hypothetical protein
MRKWVIEMGRITYIGLRLYGEDKLFPCFLERGKRLFFSKVKWCRIGHQYEMVDNAMNRRPESLGLSPKTTEEQIEKWSLEEEADRNTIGERRAAKKVDKLNLWLKQVAELHGMCEKLGFYEREAVAKKIVKLIMWGKEK